MTRVGIGYDIHRLKKGRPLLLGGVRIPHPRGLDGHSDADVLLHAVIDALLGAAALGDIGHYFPPGRAETKDLDSQTMLAKALQEIRRAGYRVENIDSVVIAEAPKLAPHRERIRKNIARLLGVPVSAVGVKGKTNEGLDSVGQGRAIAAQAVALLRDAKRKSE